MTAPTKTPKLPRLDRAAIAAEETARVEQALAEHRDDPEALLRASAKIVDVAQGHFDSLRPQRDALGLSLSLYDHRRAVNTSMGLSRTAFHELRCSALGITKEERASGWLDSVEGPHVIEERARKHKVKRIKDAADRIGVVAEEALRSEERAKAARKVRDEAAVVLSGPPHNWSRPSIAAIIGKNPSRISHINNAASKKASVPS